MAKKPANLRTCASCEWIFSLSDTNGDVTCPKCYFGSYGAFYVYGNKAYTYHKKQTPWLEKKLARYSAELHKEIIAAQPKPKTLFTI